jgi:hypothetical protein
MCSTTGWTERKEVTGSCRELRKTGFHDFYFHPNIIRMMESRSTRWTGHGGRMGGKTYIPSFDKGTLEERFCPEDVVVFGMTVRTWILKK